MKSLEQILGYKGKNVVITGAASGMGKAAVDLLVSLGANVYTIVRRNVDLPGTTVINKGDMSEYDVINEIIKALPGKIDALFLCHGMAATQGAPLKVQKVNFIGQRYMAEQLLPRISDNGSIAFITSVAGFGWQSDVKTINDFLACTTYDQMMAWCESNPSAYERDSYGFSKKSLNAYVKSRALLKMYTQRKIRLNAICPGYTITGLTEAFDKSGSATGDAMEGKKTLEKMILEPWGGRPATAEEMGYPLVAMGSDMFSYMSGQTVFFDYGLTSKWEFDGVLNA
jgi:NAD(P)-dependent dehydrogenase (short-subunit alcohol dehydrogenase family)